jgi:excinuclease UvrABC nuclease subunit
MVEVELTVDDEAHHFTFLFEKQRREKNENEDTYASIYYGPFGDET